MAAVDWLGGIGGLISGLGSLFGEGGIWGPADPLEGPSNAYQKLAMQASANELQRQMLGQEPKFGYVSTITPQQQGILDQLLAGGGEPGFQPVAQPTYAPMELPGAATRTGTLERLMNISPEAEQARIETMSRPAIRQFEEQILPSIQTPLAGTGNFWNPGRVGQELKAGTDLAENLAAMGEQYRMQSRQQALGATGQGFTEAMGPLSAGLQRYGLEMEPFMQAQGLGSAEGIARNALMAQLLNTSLQDYYTHGSAAFLTPEEKVEYRERSKNLPPWELPGGPGEPPPGPPIDEGPKPPEDKPRPPDPPTPPDERPKPIPPIDENLPLFNPVSAPTIPSWMTDEFVGPRTLSPRPRQYPTPRPGALRDVGITPQPSPQAIPLENTVGITPQPTSPYPTSIPTEAVATPGGVPWDAIQSQFGGPTDEASNMTEEQKRLLLERLRRAGMGLI